MSLAPVAGLAPNAFAKTSGESGGGLFRWFRVPSVGQIAVIEFDGAIYDSRYYNRLIHKYNSNPFIKVLVLRIDSPGGEVGPVQEIVGELKKFRDSGRPVVASLAGVAASGGYYLAAATDRIVSNPGTLTGSIGVIMEFPDAENLLKKIGVKFVVVKSGRFKDTGSFARAMTEEELAQLRRTVDDVYDQFVDEVWEGRREAIKEAVARERGVPVSKVPAREARQFLRDIADGRVMSGREAREAGLVDEMGGFDDALDTAMRLGGLHGRPIIVSEKRRREAGWADLLGSWFLGSEPQVSRLARNRVSLQYMLH